ncbi:hypothetical protein OHB07_39320 (plasmid) [Streptomyces sp. NBC_00111]|uniref:hypothetical protein n=1 Tax=Streptomyces sp. NBC_00111 TaxID=2975655 RepID=UPI002F910B0D
MHRPHHPERRPSAISSAAQAAQDDFENAVFIGADRPVVTDDANAVNLSFEELQLCGAEPLGLVVLLNWRFRTEDGLPCAPEDIWASLAERGILDADGESPLLLDDVTRALAFLDRSGALGGEL